MKRISSVLALVVFASLAAAAPALADIAPDPCMGKAAGDACTTPDMKAGNCQLDPATNVLTCTAASSSSSSSGSGSSSSGETGSSSSSSSGGDPGDDTGCAFRGASSVPLGMVSGGLALLAIGSLVTRRRRR